MGLLKSKLSLNEISEYSWLDFSVDSSYLWIWNPTNIPPHMGLSVDGRYFSVKANGVDFNSPVEDIVEIISRKKLPVLAIELDLDFRLDQCKTEFDKYDRTIAHEVTCLNPIKSVLGFPEVMKLSELLIELETNASLGRKISWNIKEPTLVLPDYSMEDIHAHLVSLSK